MKGLFLSTCCLLLFTSSVLIAQQREISIGSTHHDSSINREADKTFKEERSRWMQEMHRAEPGVNVHVLNNQIRQAKRWLWEGATQALSLRNNENSLQIKPGLFGYWNERGSNNQAGRTRSADIDFETGMIYVAADGGQIWRGTLDGKDWTSLNDPERFPGVRSLHVVRQDDLFRIVVVHGAFVRYSDDGGETWQVSDSLDNIQRWGGFSRGILTDGAEPVLYAFGNEWNYGDPWKAFRVLYRSTDFGNTFERVRRFEQGQNMIDIWSPYGENYLYMIHGDTLSRIHPEGDMEVVKAPLEFEDGMEGISRMNLRGSNGELLYLHIRRNGTNEMYVSGDSGKAWVQTGVTTGLFDRNSFAVSPSKPQFVVAGGIEVLYSRDAGIRWDTVNKWGAYYGDPENLLHADIPFVQFFTFPDSSERMLISTDGGLYRSDDGLVTVKNLSLKGLGVSQYYSVYTSRADTNFIFAGSQDQGFQRAEIDSEGILDFDQGISGDYGHITSGDEGKSLWTNYPGFSMYYPDALREKIGWGRSRDFPTKGHLWLPPIVADPDTPHVAWVAGGGIDSGAHLIRMEYDSASRKVEASEHPYDFSDGEEDVKLTALAISPLNTENWYAITSNGRFWTSSNRGDTWQEGVFSPPGGHHFYGAAIVPSESDPDLLYVAGSGYSNPGVWISRDNGETFDSLNYGLPPTLVFDLDASQDDRFLFAATAVGPYMYLADSGAWRDISNGQAPDQTWWAIDYVDEIGVARFGTFGRGIWDFRLVRDTTNSVNNLSATVAANIGLKAEKMVGSGEYKLIVDMPRSGFVSLALFDLTGRKVTTLYKGMLEEGSYPFYWNGEKENGELLPSGEYVCIVSGFGTIAHVKVPVIR